MFVRFNIGYYLPRSNMISGFGSSISIGGNYYSFTQPTKHKLTVWSALHSNWKAVGDDFYSCVDSTPGFTPRLEAAKIWQLKA
ncbi:MAG: hypothetical protein KAR40_01410 [Candidatus Sabulitectum sp.]|nr:hypothetical protein [Candidatus Sabulitectum sp.]